MFYLKFFFVFLGLSVSCFTFAQTPVQVTKAPAWVNPVVIPEVGDVPIEQVQDGVYYLLIDSQVRAESNAQPVFYYHDAEYIVNSTGVERSSQINIGYDPTYERFSLHSLQIIRDGNVIDKMNSARMKVLQREDEMENLIYNGVLTLNIILDDVRVGDIIEYSYSREGMNPVYQNIFAFSQYLSWSVPVGDFSVRVIWNKPKPLYSQVSNSTLEVRELKTLKGNEYLLRGKNIAPVQRESNTPDWFSPWGVVYFSELNTWEAVANWGEQLYQGVVVSDAEIDKIVIDIQSKFNTKQEQVSAALRFVQDEIRYLGIELAQNSHVPTPAPETLNNRYGDCKDKTVLFLTLLKKLGVEAYPALVNTDQKLENILPNIRAFDHVITYVKLDGKTYWLDPTRTFQWGGIESIHQPDYGSALVLREGESDLTSMRQVLDKYGVFVHDVFEIASDGDIAFTTTTKRLGWNAERERAYLAQTGEEKLQREYLEFFQGYYPGASVASPIEVGASNSGEMVTTERYRIKEFWEDNTEKQRFTADFYANIISSSLTMPNERMRIHPYYLTYPERIEQKVELRFNDNEWYFEDEAFEEDNAFFSFTSNIQFNEQDSKLILQYSYTSKKELVEAAEFPDYVAALEKLDNQLSYSIFRNYASQSGQSTSEPDPWYYEYLTVPIVIGAYFGLYLLLLVMWRIDRKLNPGPEESMFYPVSFIKLMVMWVLTFGLYGAYWFYKNFQYIKRENNDSSLPVLRGFFYTFWFYPLWQSLKADNDERFDVAHLPNKPIAILMASVFLIAGLFGSSDVLWIPALLLSALLVMPLANYILFVNSADSDALKYNSKWSFRHWLLGILSAPLLTLTVGEEVGLLAHEAVIRGERLLDYDIQLMERRGIIQPGDKVHYFYSDALLFKSDDGNGFTQRHVFSYWKEGGEIYSATAQYSDIQDFEVNWASNELENTTVNVVRNDGSSFVLYVSGSDKKDKVFVNQLRSVWDKAR